MAYGDGTKPRQRRDGYWVASVEAGWTERGTRRRRSVVAKTEAECKRRLRALKREMLTSDTQTISARTTLKAWIDTWKGDYARRARPGVYVDDMSMVTKWIIPTIGHRRVADLAVADLRRLDQAILDAGRSQTTARYVRLLLHRILKAAIIEGLPVPQPVMLAPKPRAARSSREAIPVDDCATLLRTAARAGTWPDPQVEDWMSERQAREVRRAHHRAAETHHSRWLAALLQGMRQGECRGLTWDRIDLDRGLVIIDRQVTELPANVEDAGPGYEHITGRFWWGPTKTSAGQRVLPLVPWMAAALAEWREVCPPSEWGLVWPRPSGDPYSPADDRAAWRGLQDTAGVHKGGSGTKDDPWRYWVVHEARHSTATLLMALQVPAPVVISIMGHTAISTTRGYQHADIEQARQALEGVAGLLRLGEVVAEIEG